MRHQMRRMRHRRHLGKRLIHRISDIQSREMTEHFIYSRLAGLSKDPQSRKILQSISEEERKHADYWKPYTLRESQGRPLRIFFHEAVTRILGFPFSLKLMGQSEASTRKDFEDIAQEISEAGEMVQEESTHEKQLLGMLDEDRLKYVGSMILGVNDALVELTGALAGFTLAFQNTGLIAVTGLITGIAASLSMGASEYLSTQAEARDRDPLKASVYTGFTYIVTVILLIIPYFLLSNVYLALALTLSVAVVIIMLFSFYISVARDVPFKTRFLQMAGISLGVSALTFIIGWLIRSFLGLEI